MDIDKKLNSVDMFGETIQRKSGSLTSKRFIIPPFSVLNTREGDWQSRKRAWLRLGIKSEIGRDNSHENSTMAKISDGMSDELKDRFISSGSGTSVFDPVLCELIYRWFCPDKGQIIDPFAGGSVRGVVASCLGLKYWGSELREEQVLANIKQGNEIVPENRPTWVCGDSTKNMENAPMADLLFSCPPYGNLEVYSDLPGDISNMEYQDFVIAYSIIIEKSINKLTDNRFACFVVSNFRNTNGTYNQLESDTIRIFNKNGMKLYNEAILINAIGSLPVRITRQFNSGRKLGRTHQKILIFIKGDWRKAVKELPEIY